MREDQEQLVGHLMRVASKVAMQEGLEPGYRIVINDGPDARTLFTNRFAQTIIVWIICRTNRLPPPHSCHWWKEVRLASSLSLILLT